PGNIPYDTPKTKPPAGQDVVDPSITNDEFLAGADWEDVIKAKINDESAYTLFKTALSTRFYARMSKHGIQTETAKSWLLATVGLEGTDISTKDIFGEADLIRAVNLAYWEQYHELLFLKVE
ncbi:MAG: hypothetical protein ACREN0_06105, partial [Thermodesulfobacteriota bacterium]